MKTIRLAATGVVLGVTFWASVLWAPPPFVQGNTFTADTVVVLVTETLNTAGGTNASLTESGIDKSSGATETWAVGNSGAGVCSISTDGQLISTVSTGTAPLSVASTTLVANLNADTLDGNDSSAFAIGANYVAKAGDTMSGSLTMNTGVGTDSVVSEDGVSKSSGVTETWACSNPGAGICTITTDGQLASTVATGTAPLSVASTTVVTNLNADTLDGNDSIAIVLKAGSTMTGSLTMNTGGGTDTVLSESGLDRSSGATETLTLQNSGAGRCDVTLDGTLLLGSLAADPTGANGMSYYNTTSNKLRCFEASAWKDCDTTGGGGGFPSADGTAGAPAWNFTSDTDTGVYRNGSGDLAFSSDNNAVASISLAGLNFVTDDNGIVMSSPTGVSTPMIDMNLTGSGFFRSVIAYSTAAPLYGLRVEDAVGGAKFHAGDGVSDFFTIDMTTGAGRIGIGDTTPDAPLDIAVNAQIDGNISWTGDDNGIVFPTIGATNTPMILLGGSGTGNNRMILGYSAGAPTYGLEFVDGVSVVQLRMRGASNIVQTWDISTGTEYTQMHRSANNGTCTLDAAATATCTATVFTGAICTCSDTEPSVNGVGAVACNVSGSTLTITGAVANDASIVSYHCF